MAHVSRAIPTFLTLAVCLLPACARPISVLPIGDEHLTGPRGLAAAGGRVIVLDNQGWIWFLSTDGEVLGKKHLVKTRRGFPVGVTVEPSGNLLIADTHESRVLRLSPDGEKLLSMGDGYGSRPGQFVYPQRIVRLRDEIFVTEYGYEPNSRVQVFREDGKFLRTFGEFGTTGPRFSRPSGIVVGPDGNLYVGDLSHRILVWTPEGRYLREFGREGKAPGEMNYPWGIAGDADYLYVAEYGAGRISRYGYDGRFAGCFGSPGKGRGEFMNPRDIAVSNGYLFVADTGNDRIVRLALDAVPWRTDT